MQQHKWKFEGEKIKTVFSLIKIATLNTLYEVLLPVLKEFPCFFKALMASFLF